MEKLNIKTTTLFAAILLFSYCVEIHAQKENDLIKNDLKSRYVQFEIIEIKPDSANVYKAKGMIRAIRIRVPEYNVEVLRIVQKVNNGYDRHKAYNEIIALRKELYDFMLKFEASRFTRPDPCFYVKYLYYKNGLKIPMEEYYHLRPMYNGEYDIIHRPIDWDKFLELNNYSQLITESQNYSEEIRSLGQ